MQLSSLLPKFIVCLNVLINMIENERPVEKADIAVKISPPGFSSQTVVEGRHRSNLVLDMLVYAYIQGVPKNALSDCYCTHSALAQSSVANPLCLKIIFGSFLTEIKGRAQRIKMEI